MKPKAKYVITDEVRELILNRYDGLIPGRAIEIARQLGWPDWAVRNAAKVLGVARPREKANWSTEEMRFLELNAGHKSVRWIAEKLGRSRGAVGQKICRMGISAAVQDGYTLTDVARVFGVSSDLVARWIREKKLIAKHSSEHTQRWKVTDKALLEFAREYRSEYSLAKVSQPWFLGLVFDCK